MNSDMEGKMDNAFESAIKIIALKSTQRLDLDSRVCHTACTLHVVIKTFEIVPHVILSLNTVRLIHLQILKLADSYKLV